MCRIAGILDASSTTDVLKHQVGAMCRVQQHGGPDGEGIYIDEKYNLVFGHRRLSLIDLSEGGRQPMKYASDRLVITYNGELYNYLELTSELKSLGFLFSSTSDTEVILAAYAAWGTKAFHRFCGMFAFTLLDRDADTMYLVRDPAGIKPLYYTNTKSGLAFASEVRAFSVLQSNVANPNWPVYFLAYGHLPEPVTTIKGAKPLPKGCFLQYNIAEKTFSIESFAHFSYLEKLNNKAEVLEAIRKSLSVAVERHLLSDAPIGAFLSGGIDSSTIALLAGKYAKENLNTLSLYFNEGAYSEKAYQDIVLQRLQCNHQGYLLTDVVFQQYLPSIFNAMDLPSCDGINTWFISKYAKESGLKAVLSGLGGDELFGGYPSFQRMKVANFLQQLPNNSLRAAQSSAVKKFRRLAYLSLPGVKGKYLFLRGQFTPVEIARHLGLEESEVWKILEEQPVLPEIQYLTHKNQASWMEMNLYMQNQLLRDSDVMSMAHGIEIRVPFLDTDFIKLALQIESPIKYEGTGKQLLVEAFKDLLPEAVYNRPKMGFSFPFKEWLANNNMVLDQLAQNDKEFTKTYKLFISGQRHWSQIITLLLAKHHTVEQVPFSYA